MRFTVGESEADRVLKIVEDDSKGHFATGGKSRKTVFGKEHSIKYKTQVGRQGDRNCFLCYQAWWRGKTSEREVTVIYMEGSVKSLEQLEELLNKD